MSQIPFHKRFSRALGRNVFFVIRRIIRILPYPVFRFLAFLFVPFGQPIVWSKKKLVLQNLYTAFGKEKTDREIREIANRFFDNMGIGMIELIYFIDRPQAIIEKVTIEGQEHLDAVLKQGRGAVLLSAHFGNFILLYLRLALAGYQVNCIMRRMRDEAFEEYISDFRKKNGMKTIYSLPHRECVGQSLKSLRNNETLVILLDQHYGEDSQVYVDFFGQQAATATGPVIFSQRSGAPILPIFIVRDRKDHYKLMIDPPVNLPAPAGSPEDLVRNVAELTRIIEGYVRRYPHEWGGWLHRRWKNKPPETF